MHWYDCIMITAVSLPMSAFLILNVALIVYAIRGIVGGKK